ncbi:MAG TPA: class I SAM-dependent methyltransferase [Terriglobales bacterium]
MPDPPSVSQTLSSWWIEECQRVGRWAAFKKFLQLLWQFVRESTPEQRRQRYGDVDYDWNFRVDTTGATVGWRERLLGLFHSPYQPTEPALFHEMIGSLKIDFAQFTFIDIGSGKGRALLLASDYSLRRIIGVELFPALDRIAKENIHKYKNDAQRCFAIESICGDASEFEFPAEPLVVYLFNPLPETALKKMLGNLERSVREHPRPVWVVYHNPLLAGNLSGQKWLRRAGGTHQYAVFLDGALR